MRDLISSMSPNKTALHTHIPVPNDSQRFVHNHQLDLSISSACGINRLENVYIRDNSVAEGEH